MKLVLLAIIIASSVNLCFAQSDDNPYFLVSVNGKQGFIDRNGQVVIKPIYEQVESFADGLAPVKVKDKWGFIDKTGKIFIEPRFDEIRWSFHEDLASVRIGEKWGFIDKSGKFVIKPNLEYGHNFDDDRSIINVGKNSELKHGVIDKTGKLITEQLFEWSGWSFSEGLLDVKLNGKWGFINREGKMVIPAKYKDAEGFSEGLAAVNFNEEKSQWGFIDKSGNVVIPAQFEEGWYFKDGLAAIRKNWKYGFIDKQGKIVIEPKFDWTYSFSEGLAAVKFNGKWGFIDKSGKFIIEPKYDDVWSFNYGLAGIAIGEWKGGSSFPKQTLPFLDAKRGYIDKTGKEIWKPTK